MATDVHAVAIVLHGTGDAAEFLGFLEQRHIIGVRTVLHQLPCCGETGRASTNDDDRFWFVRGHDEILLH